MSYSDHRSRDYERERSERGSHRSSHHHSTSSSHHHSSSRNNNNNNNNSNNPVNDERDKYAGDYISICLKNLNETLSDNDLSDSIYREFRKFGNFNVKVVYDRNMTRDKRRPERIAFVNFDTHDQAKEAKRTKLNIMFHNLPLYIEPVFRNRTNAPERGYSEYSRGAPKSNRISTPPLPSSKSRNKSRSLTPASSNSRHSSISRKNYSSPESPSARRRRSTSRNYNSYRHHVSSSKLRSPQTRTSSKRNKLSKSRSHSRSRSRSRHSLPSPGSRNIRSSRKHGGPPPPPPPMHSSRLTPPSSSSSRRGNYQRDMYMSPPPPPPPPSYRHHPHAPPPPPPPPYSHRHPYARHDYNDHSYKPELNDKDATRTLFIGNLDPDVDENELKKLFDRFGYIEEIDIKRIPNKKPYAFIKYINLDMAYNAKMEMDDKLIGKFEIKIGYGKLQPTNCLWIGGLNPHTKKTSLEKYFGQYGKIREIDWNPGDQYAYVLFDNINDAEDARNNLNEKPLPHGASDELRIDYADPKRFESSIVHDKSDINRSVSRSVTRSRSRSHTRSRTQSNSVSRSRTRSRTQSKSQSRSKSPALSRSRSRSESPLPPPPSIPHKRASHGYDNGHYSGSSNDEKAYKKQKLSNTVSRKIRTPPMEDDDRSPKHPRHHSSSRHRHHHRRQHDDDNENENNEQDNDIEQKEGLNDDKMDQEEKSNTKQLIKETLINKEPQLSHLNNVSDINTVMKHTWLGVFTLKKIAFPTKFYLLAGNKNLAEQLLPINVNSSTTNLANLPSLRITQRLRLDPVKVEELEKKLYDSNYNQQQQNGTSNGGSQQSTSDNCTFSVLIALPYELDSNKQKSKSSDLSMDTNENNTDTADEANTSTDTTRSSSLQQRSLHNLIVYLNQKSAAGVIPLPDDDRPAAIVHAFPPNCQFSMKLLEQLLPNLTLDAKNSSSTSSQQNQSNNNLNYTLNSEYLIIVLLKK